MRILGYIDPGSGSLIVSAIVGGVAGMAVVFKMGWRRFVALFSPSERKRLKAEKAEKAAAAEGNQTPTPTS
jgi:hypothetical protein